MKQIILLFFSAFILAGCSSNESYFPDKISISGKMLSIGDSLNIPNSINSIDNYLIINESGGENWFTILKTDLSYFNHFGLHGEGPNELIDPSGFVMEWKNNITVYDGKKCFVTYSLDSLLQNKNQPSSFIKTNIEGSIISNVKLSTSEYIVTGVFNDDKRFTIIDSLGNYITSLGNYPLTDKKDIELPFHVKAVAFQSTMTCKPKSNRFAVASRYGGILEIYDYNSISKTINKIDGGINTFSPQLTTENIQGTLNFIPNKDTRWGYLFLTCNTHYIYALYSGLYQREGEPYISGNTIHVFDWDGKAICEITLDKRVRDIALVNNELYCLYEDSTIGYDIIQYVLPNKLL